MKTARNNLPRERPLQPSRNRYRSEPRFRHRRTRGILVGFLASLWAAVKVVFSGVFLLVFLAGVSVSLVVGYQYLMNSKYFMVKKVVLTGLERTSRADVLAATGLDRSTNILAVRLDQLGTNLRTLPWVREVTLTRRLPDTLLIQVEERRPRALVLLDSLYYLDEKGLPFKKVDSGEQPELPIVSGFTRADFTEERRGFSRRDLGEVFALLDVLAERNDRFRLANVSEVNFDKVRGLTLFTREDNVQVRIGLGEYRAKLRRLGRVLAHLKIKGEAEGLTYFNLESSPRVVVRRAAQS
ncbi:MAG: FtsQ-type POTRA domain-containing protein [Thermodesulfobacteriota bacterium]